jgi:RNA polymerase sigma factor (sigma-70 family)
MTALPGTVLPGQAEGIEPMAVTFIHTHARTARQRMPGHRLARLVHDAGRGDQRAWDALVREFSAMIWAVARAHRLDDANAADVTQATWLRLLEHLTRLHDPARVGAWLATTARHECLRVIRESARTVLYGSDAPEHPSPETPAGEALLITERDAALWQGFARLRASDQALLRLLMADPRPPYEEIAAALNIPIGSIGPTRQRALARLHSELDKQGTLTLMTA